ncbi:hypothetical protein PBV87_19100 [Niameybacter massiliensis]|uniref:Uncharacterized protein n=1 Tax=Holtiella tumoricola TaxID=3018743 RepID=A0AA42DQN8_9FIRM|nr:hypothetical protein [Holtiella tumoricola]MDA3733589.1 hypothetical protein [Holtiella tumoricola]
MQGTKQELSTYRKNEDTLLMRWLLGLLNWLSRKITNNDEHIIIVLTKEQPPTFYRTFSSITYVPPETTIEKVTLKTSQWHELKTIENLKLERLKSLIEQYVPGIEVCIGEVHEGIIGLIINWGQIKVDFIEDDKGGENQKRIPEPYRVLTFLSKNPSCIVKGRNSFKNRLGMKLDEEEKVVYVGEGATYIFNKNGFKYINQSNLNNFKEATCIDRLGIIEHREKDFTRDSYKRKVNRYLKM